MIKGRVNKLIPFSSVDGPGNRFAIFLQGCNFNCTYCHNPETINHCNNCGNCISHCKYGALYLNAAEVIWVKERCIGCDECIKNCKYNSTPKILELSHFEVMEEIYKSIPFIRGITVSGGECMLQHSFLTELFALCKIEGLTCFIDSNGSIPFWNLKKLMELTDGVMLDVKAFLDEEHMMIANKSNKTVLENLKYLLDEKKLYEVRTVVVENLFDCAKTVKDVSNLISNSEIIYKLIKYRPFGVRDEFKKKLKIPSDAFMNELKNICLLNGVKNVIIV